MDLTINQVFSFHIPYSTFKHNPPINQICPSLMLGVFSWFFSMFNIISSSLSPSYANLTHLLQNPYFPKLIFSSLLIPLQHFYILLPPPNLMNLVEWPHLFSFGCPQFHMYMYKFHTNSSNSLTLVHTLTLHSTIHFSNALMLLIKDKWQ